MNISCEVNKLPGIASLSITLCSGSDPKHMWHLCPLKNPYDALASWVSCNACVH